MAAGQQWWMAIGGHQVGPVAEEELVSNIRNGSVDASTLVFTAGMANWTPLREVTALARYLPQAPTAAPVAAPPVAPGRRSHDIDFKILGTEMQFVEVELDPGESAVAEAGAFMYMTPGIEMETVFGDGSGQQQGSGGIMGALLGAGKRILTGESLFMTVFTNTASSKQQVAFAAPYAGKILPMDLSSLGGELICQKDSFLCAARGVSIGIAFQKKIGAGLFGGEGFIMQRLQGDGLCFVHAGGTIHPLRPGGRTDDACRYRVPRGAAAVGVLRRPVRRQGEDGPVRRRRDLLRHPDRARQGVAAVAAAQPAGGPHLQGRAARREGPCRRRLDPRQLRRREPGRRRLQAAAGDRHDVRAPTAAAEVAGTIRSRQWLPTSTSSP